MSETSRSRVTITLGRTGQVVKRAGGPLDSSFSDLNPVSGSKRSVRERLGNNIDSSSQVNKRQRGDGQTTNAVDDIRLSKNDLRYKIMQKNMQKQSQKSQQDELDLRNILSRPSQSSPSSMATRDRIPDPKDTRPRYIEPRDLRQHYIARDDLRQVTRNSSPHIHEFRAEYIPDPRRQSIPESRERSILEAKDFRPHLPETRNASVLGEMPGMRVSNVNSQSPWTLERLRRRSPDEALAASRSLGAPKRDEVLQRGYAVRTYDDVRTSTYMGKDAFEICRPMSSSNLGRMAPNVGPVKTMAPSSLPLSGSLAQKSSYVVDDQVTVDSFLRSLALEKFAIAFKAEEVDMYSLKRMSERDLKELGIPMGPRKKILLALQHRMKQQA